jgi:hypothetical protein
MDLSDLLDAAGKLYVQNIVLFVSIYGIPVVLQLVFTVLGTASGLLGTVISGIGLAALINAIAARSQGEPMTLSDAYATLHLSTYAFFILGSILIVIIVGLGLVLLVVPGIFLFVRLLLFAPVIVVERVSTFESFRRSWALVEGHSWRILLYMLGLLFLVVVASALLATGMILLVVATGIVSAPRAATVYISPIVSLIVAPFVYAVLVELYFNLRALHGDRVRSGTHADAWGESPA